MMAGVVFLDLVKSPMAQRAVGFGRTRRRVDGWVTKGRRMDERETEEKAGRRGCWREKCDEGGQAGRRASRPRGERRALEREGEAVVPWRANETAGKR